LDLLSLRKILRLRCVATFCMPPNDSQFPTGSVQSASLPAIPNAEGQVVVLLLADIARGYRLWGYARFIVQRFAMRAVPGLVMFKVLGSGDEGGFGLKPSQSRQALFCLFSTEKLADAFLESSVAHAYAKRSREFCTAKLRAYACRGTWAGRSIEITAPTPINGPIAALTRASIRPLSARRFWRMQPASELSLNKASGCLLATGVGEAPFFRQATFSLWASTAAMDAYARTGAHLAAIRAANAGAFFSESMFVRFVPCSLTGSWRGQLYG
jgi:hypothetical protein